MKKFLSMLLALSMVLSMTVAFADETKEYTVVYGSTTEIGGDFWFTSHWTNGATDMMLRELSSDCSTVVTDQGGALVVNPTVTKDLQMEKNDDGSKTFTITINEGLVYNNGEAITAKDFVWSTIFACSKTAAGLGVKSTAASQVVGGQDYYDGKVAYVSGVRLIDEYTFSVTIESEYLPYFYDLSYASFGAESIKYWLGAGYDVADDGEGAYITGDFTVDALKAHVEKVRFYAGEDRVSAGPYNLVAFDKSALQATLTINKNYNGNFEGVKPSIEKIVVVRAEDATWADAIKTGAFNFYDTITDGTQVNTALDIIEDEATKAALGHGFEYVQFDRPGYGMINFACDFGPTQFLPVRQAIIKLLDRNEFANTFCQGWGGVVNGPYGTALWQYKDSEEWLEEILNSYNYDPAAAVELLVNDGWVLNAEGGEWTEGIRYKKVTAEEAGTYKHNVTLADGTILMPLIIEWSSSEGNSVSDLLAVMLAEAEATKSAGVQINQNIMTFTELLNFYYRDASQGDKYGVPTYGMFNLATNFTPLYDQSYSFTSDPQYVAQGYNLNYLFDDVLDWLTMKMVYGVDSTDTGAYLALWRLFIQRWNELMPQVPLYSNVYITMYPDWLENYAQDSFWDFQQAIVYATVAE
nr:hypothetical protein [Clostridia bacterium]